LNGALIRAGQIKADFWSLGSVTVTYVQIKNIYGILAGLHLNMVMLEQDCTECDGMILTSVWIRAEWD
jgi:hypothetical protein